MVSPSRRLYGKFRELCANPFFVFGFGILLLFLAENMIHPWARDLLLAVAWICICAAFVEAFPPSEPKFSARYISIASLFFLFGGIGLFYEFGKPLAETVAPPEETPSLAIMAITPQNIGHGNKYPGGLIEISNTGKTAIRICSWGGAILERPALTKRPPHLIYSGVTGPDIVSFGTTKTITISTSNDFSSYWDQIENGTGYLYYWGEITYENAISSPDSKKYKLSFFALYDPNQNKFVDTPFGNDLIEVSSMLPSSTSDTSTSPP